MKNVTAVGEILFDVYPEGKKIGGAPFNFLYHIIKLTGKGNFVSRIGKDDLGKEIKDYLAEKNISTKFLQTDNEHGTGISKITLNEEKVPGFVIEENRAYDFIELNPDLEKLITDETDCLYFGTLAQRNDKSENTIQELSGKSKKCFCDLNIRQKFYSRELVLKSINAADVLKLNEDELRLVNDLILNSEYKADEAATILIEKFNIDLLCITRGSEGAVLYRGREKNQFRVENKNVVDTVGAGDAYASMLCIGYLENWNIKKINRFASEFANEIVKVNGALLDDDNIYVMYKKKIKTSTGSSIYS